MTVPLIILAVLAALGGLLNLPTIAGWVPPAAHALSNWLGHTLGALPGGEAAAGALEEAAAEGAEGALNFVVAGISTVLALAGLALAYVLYRGQSDKVETRDPLQGILGPVFAVLRDKWYVDELYNFIIIRPFNWLSQFTADVIDWRFWHDWFHETAIAGTYNLFARFTAEFLDLGVVDGLISGLPAVLAQAVAGRFKRLQSGFVRGYALAVFVGVVAILGYLLYAASVR